MEVLHTFFQRYEAVVTWCYFCCRQLLSVVSYYSLFWCLQDEGISHKSKNYSSCISQSKKVKNKHKGLFVQETTLQSTRKKVFGEIVSSSTKVSKYWQKTLLSQCSFKLLIQIWLTDFTYFQYKATYRLLYFRTFVTITTQEISNQLYQ